jgi:DNA-binding NarL/FixJ family response regulator
MDRCYILLLDEDEDDYHLLKSFVQEAFNGRVGLDWFQRDGFSDIMICSGYYLLTMVEYQLGNENGLEIIRKAKAKCPNQKIFLLTSWDEQVVSQEMALEAGANAALRKELLSIQMVRDVVSPYLKAPRCPEVLQNEGAVH